MPLAVETVVQECVYMPPADGATERESRSISLINMQSRIAVVSDCTSKVVHLGQDLENHVVLACDACGWEHNKRHDALIGWYI